MHAAGMISHLYNNDAHTPPNSCSVAITIHFTVIIHFHLLLSSTITIRTMSRCGSDDESETDAESELKRLREEVKSLRAEKGVKLSMSKKALRKELRVLSKAVMISEELTEFIVQYLFPRFKFLHDSWDELDNSDRNSFSSVVRRHFPLNPGRNFDKDWTKILVPSIAVKYTQLRCNVNNMIREQFKGAYAVSRKLTLSKEMK